MNVKTKDVGLIIAFLFGILFLACACANYVYIITSIASNLNMSATELLFNHTSDIAVRGLSGAYTHECVNSIIALGFGVACIILAVKK